MRLRFKDAEGMHKARLSEIREGYGRYGPYLRLVFTVIEGEFKDHRFSGIVRPTLIRQGRFYRWVIIILGHEPDELSTDELIGKACMIYLSKKVEDYTRILCNFQRRRMVRRGNNLHTPVASTHPN